jgi:hypothetical protein
MDTELAPYCHPRCPSSFGIEAARLMFGVVSGSEFMSATTETSGAVGRTRRLRPATSASPMARPISPPRHRTRDGPGRRRSRSEQYVSYLIFGRLIINIYLLHRKNLLAITTRPGTTCQFNQLVEMSQVLGCYRVQIIAASFLAA